MKTLLFAILIFSGSVAIADQDDIGPFTADRSAFWGSGNAVSTFDENRPTGSKPCPESLVNTSTALGDNTNPLTSGTTSKNTETAE